MYSRRGHWVFPAVAALAVAVLACNNINALPAATIENAVDTVSLFALDGTPPQSPSGYNLRTGVVRTDLSTNFDFAFNITPEGKPVLLPTGALKLGRGSGIQLQTIPFDAVTTAPDGPYVDTLPVVLDSGTVAILRSRVITCAFGGTTAYYGKIEVLAIDPQARRIDFQALVDQNCGYRGLEPGFPRR